MPFHSVLGPSLPIWCLSPPPHQGRYANKAPLLRPDTANMRDRWPGTLQARVQTQCCSKVPRVSNPHPTYPQIPHPSLSFLFWQMRGGTRLVQVPPSVTF